MTGFQPHPGLETNVLGQAVPSIPVENLCASLGLPVTILDPYDLESTSEHIFRNWGTLFWPIWSWSAP